MGIALICNPHFVCFNLKAIKLKWQEVLNIEAIKYNCSRVKKGRFYFEIVSDK